MSVTTFNECLNSDIYSFFLFTSCCFMKVTNTKNFLFCYAVSHSWKPKIVIFFLEKVKLRSDWSVAHYSDQRDVSQEAGCVHSAQLTHLTFSAILFIGFDGQEVKLVAPLKGFDSLVFAIKFLVFKLLTKPKASYKKNPFAGKTIINRQY